jgi:3-phosphoinositide dependent protein kinase-1
LEFGSLLGEGAFARVKHTKNVKTGQSFALKTVEKRQVQAQQRMKSIVNERNIHASLEHEGIVRLYCAWQDDYAVYFALELVEGGDLAAQISRMGTCPLSFSQFYSAELVVILEYLRLRRLVHRDLKPENLLLTLRGHLKLCDFDAAVIVPDEGDGDVAGGCGQGQKMPSAGTTLYLAPEVLNGTVQFRLAFALDLWALGCILYQMLVGQTPFHSSPEYVVVQRIKDGDYSFPSGFQHKAAHSLIEALLTAEPTARPGMGVEGLEEVRRHSFFGGSAASFNELLQCRPPHRVAPRGLLSELEWSEESSHHSDLASSAECTPEVGQCFLARHSDAITVATSTCIGEFTMSVQTDYKPAASADHQYVYPATASHAPMQPPTPTRLAPEEVQRAAAAQRLDVDTSLSAPPTPSSVPSSACRWLRPDRPFLSWSQWMSELVARQTLMENENVLICGSVVRRRIPCLRMKVLMLTDTPRLLLLNSSGVRLLTEFPLVGEGASKLVAKSHSDFELSTARRRYCCYDVNAVEEWESKLEAARERALRQHESCN